MNWLEPDRNVRLAQRLSSSSYPRRGRVKVVCNPTSFGLLLALMSFELYYHYLIEPKSVLQARAVAVLDARFAEFLLERVLICKPHVKGHNESADELHLQQLKLVHLGRLRHDITWDTSSQFMDLFGSQELSTELFDRWWNICEIENLVFADLKYVLDLEQ